MGDAELQVLGYTPLSMPVIVAPEHIVTTAGPWQLARFVTWIRPDERVFRFRSGLLYGTVSPKLVAGFLAVSQCMDLADLLRDAQTALDATGVVPEDARGAWKISTESGVLVLNYQEKATGLWKPRWRFTDPVLLGMAAQAMAGASVFVAEQQQRRLQDPSVESSARTLVGEVPIGE